MTERPLTVPKTCQCGGQLCIGTTGHKLNKKFTHIVIKCRNCGAWHGGVTRKIRKKEMSQHDKGRAETVPKHKY